MSTLTEAVLYLDIGADNKEMRAALDAPVDPHSGQGFAALDHKAAGGYKVFCGLVYAACFNYVIPEHVEEFVRALPWGYGAGVLVIDYEHEEGLRVLNHGRLVADDAGVAR